MRIAVGGIATESCTFSPFLTQLDAFRVERGAELLNGKRKPFHTIAEFEKLDIHPMDHKIVVVKSTSTKRRMRCQFL